MKGRAQQRGKPLEWFCKSATVSKYEYGENDTRSYCYGMIDMENDEYLDECRECGAFVDNVTLPIE